MDIVPLRACLCGKPASPYVVEIAEAITLWACQECMTRHQARLDKVRPIFETMITVGIPRDLANETMSFMLDRVDLDTMERRDCDDL